MQNKLFLVKPQNQNLINATQKCLRTQNVSKFYLKLLKRLVTWKIFKLIIKLNAASCQAYASP